MENSNIIFKKEGIEIFWQVGSTPMNSDNKGVKVRCTAKNPFDGKEYSRFAGWLSKSLALHGGVETRSYIHDRACNLISENSKEILDAILSFLENQRQVDVHPNGVETKTSFAIQLKKWKEANAGNAGKGISYKTAHPSGEGQRQKVREAMQANAPKGTNHL